MTWLAMYCGTGTPSVLSSSVPNAFSLCFSDSVLQTWDMALLLIVLLFLSSQRSKKRRIALHLPLLPSFQRMLLLILTALPLLSLLAAVADHTASPSRIVALVLRSLTLAGITVLLSVLVSPSRYEGFHIVSYRLVQALHGFLVLSLLSTAFAVYGVMVSLLHQPVLTTTAVLVVLSAVIHCAVALTSVAVLIAIAHPTSPLSLEILSSDSLSVNLPSSSSATYAVHDEDEEELFDSSDGDDSPGCLSSFTFSWVTPTIRLGLSQGFLHLTDVAPLPSIDSTSDIATSFAVIWRQQIASGSPSLLWAFWSLLGSVYVWLGVLKFISDLTVFIGPLLLNSLVTFLTSQTDGGEAEAAWHGYLYALGLVGGVVVSSVLGTQYTYRSRRVSMRVRSAMVSLVYSKSLSISGMAKRHFSSGQVTNIMSVDTERVMDICTSFHDFWSLPVQIAVALYLLHAQVGLALLAGLGVVLLLIPINAVLTKKIAAVSRRMMGFKDKRVQLINELLHQIRTIKSMALEPRFQRKIEAVRRKEMGSLTTRKYLDAMCVYFWATTPILVSLATFSMYALLGNQLTAARVFTSLALFNTLIRPLNSFPWVINGLVEGRVSALRVYKFLCAEDREEGGALKGDKGEEMEEGTAVVLEGSFAYQKVERNSGVTAHSRLVRSNGVGHVNGSLPVSSPIKDASVHPLEEKQLSPDRDLSTPLQQLSRASVETNGAAVNGRVRKRRKRRRKVEGKGGSVALRVSPPALAYIFHLEDVSLHVRAGQFVGICGPVGSGLNRSLLPVLSLPPLALSVSRSSHPPLLSAVLCCCPGKSSLLLAMLGELWGMKRAQLPPRVCVQGRVAYVAQEA